MDKLDKLIIEFGIPKAIEKANREGLRLGQVVAHCTEKLSFILKNVEGAKAIVHNPEKKGSEKEFPINELFDPNDVLEMIEEVQLQAALEQFRHRNDN